MCEWFYKKGRCGAAFPTNADQFGFIGEDVVTPDIMKIKKAECHARSSPSLFSLSAIGSAAKTIDSDSIYDLFDNFEN